MSWTKYQETRLRKEYGSTLTAKLAQEFEKSESAVRKKAQRLGLKKRKNHQGKLAIEDAEIDKPELDDEDLNWFISGLVAGEGTFTASNQKGRNAKKYRFSITLAECDKKILYKIKDYLSVGDIYEYDKRDENWQPTVKYNVRRLPELAEVIIPFFEEYKMFDTEKQKQFEEWAEKIKNKYDLE